MSKEMGENSHARSAKNLKQDSAAWLIEFSFLAAVFN